MSYSPEYEALLRAGAMLATYAFNLAQSDELDERQRRSLVELYKAWDAALPAYAATLRQAARVDEVTDEMVERAWLAYDESVEASNATDLPSMLRVAMRAALEAALSAQPAERQGECEPVAWRLRIGCSNVWSYCEEEWQADFYGRKSGTTYEKRPMYAHPAAPVGVPDGMVLDAEDWAVLRRLRRALPDVGLNGWHRGVTVLDKVLAAAPSAPQGSAQKERK